MNYRRSSLSVILHSITGFIILLVFLIVANILISSVNDGTYTNIVQFFNSLLSLFVILFLVGMINSLFWNFEFPLNLIAPISGGVLGVFIVSLIFKLLAFAQTFVYFDVIEKILSYNLSAIVFFATLIIGYLIIITEESRRAGRYAMEDRDYKEKVKKEAFKEEIKQKDMKEKMSEEKKKQYKPEFTWEEVGDEFKKASLNVGKAINKAFDGKKEKNVKKKKITKKKIKKGKF